MHYPVTSCLGSFVYSKYCMAIEAFDVIDLNELATDGVGYNIQTYDLVMTSSARRTRPRCVRWHSLHREILQDSFH